MIGRLNNTLPSAITKQNRPPVNAHWEGRSVEISPVESPRNFYKPTRNFVSARAEFFSNRGATTTDVAPPSGRKIFDNPQVHPGSSLFDMPTPLRKKDSFDELQIKARYKELDELGTGRLLNKRVVQNTFVPHDAKKVQALQELEALGLKFADLKATSSTAELREAIRHGLSETALVMLTRDIPELAIDQKLGASIVKNVKLALKKTYQIREENIALARQHHATSITPFNQNTLTSKQYYGRQGLCYGLATSWIAESRIEPNHQFLSKLSAPETKQDMLDSILQITLDGHIVRQENSINPKQHDYFLEKIIGNSSTLDKSYQAPPEYISEVLAIMKDEGTSNFRKIGIATNLFNPIGQDYLKGIDLIQKNIYVYPLEQHPAQTEAGFYMVNTLRHSMAASVSSSNTEHSTHSFFDPNYGEYHFEKKEDLNTFIKAFIAQNHADHGTLLYTQQYVPQPPTAAA